MARPEVAVGHTLEPFTSIGLWGSAVIVVAALILLLRRPVTRKRAGLAALAAALGGFGLWLLLDIPSIGATVNWDLAQGVERGRLTGTAPAWSTMLTEAVLGPVFVLLGAAAARGAK